LKKKKKLYNDIEKSVLRKYKAQTGSQTLSKAKFVMAIDNQRSSFDLNHVYVSKKSESANLSKNLAKQSMLSIYHAAFIFMGFFYMLFHFLFK
jgi:hypothetical protein